MVIFRYVYAAILAIALMVAVFTDFPLFGKILLPLWIAVMFIINEVQLQKKKKTEADAAHVSTLDGNMLHSYRKS